MVDETGKRRLAAVQHHQRTGREHPDRCDYREPFKQRRCLVTASGWYEWQKLDAKKMRPIHMRPAAAPFAFAYNVWKGANGQ